MSWVFRDLEGVHCTVQLGVCVGFLGLVLVFIGI